MAEVLYFIPGAIGISLLHRLAVAKGPEAARMVAAGCRHSLHANLFLALVLAGSGGLLVRWIFTTAFEPSVLPLLLLLPGVAIYGLAHITTPYFNAYVRRPMINTLIAGLSILIQSILIVLLVPLMGLAGAALGTSIGYIIAVGVNFAIFRRVAGVKLKEVFLLKTDDLRVYKGYLSSLRVQIMRRGNGSR
jgi:O-antigen/teichoic acid export membrane protein